MGSEEEENAGIVQTHKCSNWTASEVGEVAEGKIAWMKKNRTVSREKKHTCETETMPHEEMCVEEGGCERRERG